MDASPALVRGKVRIVDHLFLLIFLKKHVSRCHPVPPVDTAIGRAAVGVVTLGGERVGQCAVEGGHGSTSPTRTLRKRLRWGVTGITGWVLVHIGPYCDL